MNNIKVEVQVMTAPWWGAAVYNINPSSTYVLCLVSCCIMGNFQNVSDTSNFGISHVIKHGHIIPTRTGARSQQISV